MKEGHKNGHDCQVMACKVAVAAPAEGKVMPGTFPAVPRVADGHLFSPPGSWGKKNYTGGSDGRSGETVG